MRSPWTKTAVLLLTAVALPLAACGKKSNPKPPSQVEAEAKEEKTE